MSAGSGVAWCILGGTNSGMNQEACRRSPGTMTPMSTGFAAEVGGFDQRGLRKTSVSLQDLQSPQSSVWNETRPPVVVWARGACIPGLAREPDPVTMRPGKADRGRSARSRSALSTPSSPWNRACVERRAAKTELVHDSPQT